MPATSHTDASTDVPHPVPARRRRRLIGVGLFAVVVMLSVVLVWFRPQVLFYDRVVEDDFPSTAPVTGRADAESPEAARTPEPETSDGDAAADPDPPARVEAPVSLVTGSFGSRNRYTVTGDATVYELSDAARILRLEGFASTNGPDLFVYLTVGDAAEPNDAELAAEYVDLGVLRGNVGDQNYDLPADVDLARYDTVVIWCRRFGTAFGAADLR
ncbi:DM13 domain-containing protein [Egicoccus sp. AB-alg2]|uniref:DM13 domain-containing protein n=1 Tax=Egicoccus sp. AB-alg2 TaxID=3242693 RepID=UPI00359F0E26